MSAPDPPPSQGPPAGCGGSVMPPPAEGWRWRGVHGVTTAVCLIGLHPVLQLPSLLVKGQAATRLMAYSVISLVIGVPVLVTQITLGTSVKCGMVGLFSKFTPVFKGVGIAFLMRSLQGIMGYQMMVGHVLFYFWGSLTSPQAWSSCDNVWNSPLCGKEIAYGNSTFTVDSMVTFDRADAEREYYLRHVNDTRTNLTDWSSTDVSSLVPTDMTLHKAMTLGVAWFFVLILVIPGVKAFGWLVICICILLMATLCGLLGYGWYFRPRDPFVLLRYLYTAAPDKPDPHPVMLLMDSIEAAFFSLSLVSGVYPAIGKFSGGGSIKRCGTGLFSWLVVTSFPHVLILILAPFTAHLEDMEIHTGGLPATIVAMGIGSNYLGVIALYRELMTYLFILWPKIVSNLDLTPVISALFYVMFFLLGLTYSGLVVLVVADALVEGCARSMVDAYHGVAATTICILGLGISLLFTTDVGSEWKNLLTGYVYQLDFIYIFLLLFFFCVFLAKSNLFQGTFSVLSGVWFSISTFILLVTAVVRTFFVPSDGESVGVLTRVTRMGWLVAAVPLITCVTAGALHALGLTISRRPTSSSKLCGALCCGEELEVRTNVVSPERLPGPNIVLTLGAGTSAPYAPGYHQSAPPYYLYDRRPICPAPNGAYQVPKPNEEMAPEAWQQVY